MAETSRKYYTCLVFILKKANRAIGAFPILTMKAAKKKQSSSFENVFNCAKKKLQKRDSSANDVKIEAKLEYNLQLYSL